MIFLDLVAEHQLIYVTTHHVLADATPSCSSKGMWKRLHVSLCITLLG